MATFLVQDPFHEYAARFIRLLRERYGHRAIAFYTVSAKERFYRRREGLPESAFAASYEVDPGDLDNFAAYVRVRHPDLKAILPYSEETLELTASLQDRLGLRWNDGATLARFRQKAALKEHIRYAAPSVRLNFSCKVSSAAQVFALGPSLPPKFVLKPDSGFGSRGVAFFSPDQRLEIERYFGQADGPCILEEFLDGALYAVDGLVDAQGNAAVASIFSSGRQHLNGCPVVYGNGVLIHQDTPLFAELAAYARSVMAASGLRQSPFHMEVIRDRGGPCLVEVGARLIGHSHAFTCERVHGGTFDFFGRAAAGYLGERVDLRISFAHYDRVQAVKVYGASQVDGTAYEVRGREQVEALPSFDRWIVKPQEGARLRRTVDLFTVPYSLVLVGRREDGPLEEVGEDVHRRLVFQTKAPVLNRGRADAVRVARKLRSRAEWMAEQTRRWVSSGGAR
ncbi:MAG: hypothetical protein NVS2B9_10190 [Myxococcales bacterium]